MIDMVEEEKAAVVVQQVDGKNNSNKNKEILPWIILGIFMACLCYFGLKAIVISISEFHIPTFIIGFILLSVGLAPLLIYARRKLIKHKIMKFNIVIETTFLDVIDAEYDFIGNKPWVIRSQYWDKQNNTIHQFTSFPISNNPSKYLSKDLKIPVFINPDNPKKYYMDLATMPELKHILDNNTDD